MTQTLTQTQDAEPDYDWDDWERPDAAFCDGYTVHEKHVYSALNSNTYLCPGLTDADMASLEAEAAQPPCEHGMSASLCAGPMHYPADHLHGDW